MEKTPVLNIILVNFILKVTGPQQWLNRR